MAKSLKDMRADYKEAGVFYTPEPLCELMLSYNDIEHPRDVYDPTVGGGNLLALLPDDVPKFGQEIDADSMAETCKRLANFTGAVGDTLAEPAFMGRRFHLILANPPFSTKWNSKALKDDERFAGKPIPADGHADYAFILHCVHLLADDGLCVLMDSMGILKRGGREAKCRRWLVENNLLERIVYVPGGMFEDTAIATCILVIRKNKTTTDIEFENLETGNNKTVSYEDIAARDFDLWVDRYTEPEKPFVIYREDFEKAAFDFLMFGAREKARKERIEKGIPEPTAEERKKIENAQRQHIFKLASAAIRHGLTVND